ncbi:HAD hydrolase-like protein [Bacillus sp. 1P10SD]|uniref:5' nucleotidase, NT5C type n=1 Tax=Bacillus sp. 1P10SD TaxID=3132265 RepID=UPI0039A75E97
MKFGFDIDDTLINLREHAFHLYNKKLQKAVPIEAYHSLTTLEIHEPFGLSDQEGSRMWHDSLEEIYYTDCSPFPHAVEVLNELKLEGHEIYYITSRPVEHCERTRNWLVKAGFPVDEHSFYCGMKDSEKINIIQDLGLDYYFDDKPAVLGTLMESGSKVLMKNSSYNLHIQLPRIHCWSELKKILLEDKK